MLAPGIDGKPISQRNRCHRLIKARKTEKAFMGDELRFERCLEGGYDEYGNYVREVRVNFCRFKSQR